MNRPGGIQKAPLGHLQAITLPMLGKLFACIILVVSLSGCSDDGVSDLQGYVKTVKLKNTGHVEPLPEIKPFETFVYNADTIKDPFVSWSSGEPAGTKMASTADGLLPDVNRRKEILEGFPLDTMKMKGILEYQGETWALIKAPDGIIYRVKDGNHMGQNHGKIQEIHQEKVVLTEIIPNGLGGWEERQASLNLNEE